MQEEVENKTVNLAVSTTKLTGRTLMNAFRTYLYHKNNVKMRRALGEQHGKVIGKQSVKELMGRGEGLSVIEIADGSAREFCKTAKKFGVDYAIRKDKSCDPPRYTVFFKAKDAEVLQQVLKDYVLKNREKEPKEKKQSILEQLRKFKEKIAENHEQKKQKQRKKIREKEKTR